MNQRIISIFLCFFFTHAMGQRNAIEKARRCFHDNNFQCSLAQSGRALQNDATKNELEPLYLKTASLLALAKDNQYSIAHPKVVSEMVNSALKLKKHKDFVKDQDSKDLLKDCDKFLVAEAESFYKGNDEKAAAKYFDYSVRIANTMYSRYMNALLQWDGNRNQAVDLMLQMVNDMLDCDEKNCDTLKLPFRKLVDYFTDQNNLSDAFEIMKKERQVFPSSSQTLDEYKRVLLSYASTTANARLAALKVLNQGREFYTIDSIFLYEYIAIASATCNSLISSYSYFKADSLSRTVIMILEQNNIKGLKAYALYLGFLYQNKYEFALRRVLENYINTLPKTERENMYSKIMKEFCDHNHFDIAYKIFDIAIQNYPQSKVIETAKKQTTAGLARNFNAFRSAEEALENIKVAKNILPAGDTAFSAVEKRLLKDVITKSMLANNFSKAGKYLQRASNNYPRDEEFKKMRKAFVIRDYKENYLKTNSWGSHSWNGSAENCNPGSSDATLDSMVLARINYFRRIEGLDDDVVLLPERNRKCMCAALMMQANGTLSHYPPQTWKCYSKDGRDAASSSNLAFGATGSYAVTSLMEDDGGNNNSVGHRTWILNRYAKNFGHGSSSDAMVLWVTGADEYRPDEYRGYTAWPPPGDVPSTLVFSRWSFNSPSANLNQAKVTVTINGINVPVEMENSTGTLVWNIPGWKSNTNATVTVSIKGMKGYDGKVTEVNYTINVMVIN